jgi:hypothetical protein
MVRGRVGLTAERLTDVLTAATFVGLLVPAVIVATAAIKAESSGSVFLWCHRVGFGGRKIARPCSRGAETRRWGLRAPSVPSRAYRRRTKQCRSDSAEATWRVVC